MSSENRRQKMRLIDVDRITDSDIADYLGAEYCSCAPDVRDMLNDQPTAYDLDGVVNGLKRERFIDSETVLSDVHQGYNAGLSRAIDIVKDGAMSEEKTRTSPWISVREKLPECGIPVVVLLQGQHPEDVVYEVAELVDLSVDTKIQGKYWYKKGCGYLQHPAYVDGCGCFPGYEVVAWLPVPEKYEREEEQGHETN